MTMKCHLQRPKEAANEINLESASDHCEPSDMDELEIPDEEVEGDNNLAFVNR
jgi:hypothetical protein